MKNTLFFLLALVILASCSKGKVNGDKTIWSKLTIDFEGPMSSELGNPNPFTDFRLDVEFTGPSGEIFKVPGYYAATGIAAETSDSTGNIWRVNFCPGETGKWQYKAHFVKGKNIAATINGGESAGYFDGAKGSFDIIEAPEKDSLSFQKHGKLEYVGEHFLRFRGSKEYFIKGGANSPEVLLEYAGFDNTPSERTYPEHIKDWRQGDPLWKGDQGKGIVGVMNYLSSLGLNSYYFLSMNAYGDGKKAWPWLHQDSIFRYDCSKLDQWDILFRHMNRKGISINMVLTETENEALFEEKEFGQPGGFADSRKIYFREMVARFGYLPAITWNIGEENGWDDPKIYQKANTDEQRKAFADYIRKLTYYKDHITVHNGPSWDKHIYSSLYGHNSITGPSFQWDFGKNIYNEILDLRLKSDSAKHKWVIYLDEPYVDPPTKDIHEWRKDNVWATFMAGGAGIELYIGSGLDVTEQNLRPYETHYKTMAVALDFFKKYVPFHQLQPALNLIENGWALKKGNELFVLYLPAAEQAKINLPDGQYNVKWYNPIKGGNLQTGSIPKIDGGKGLSVGLPPTDTTQDWVCLIQKR